MKKIRHVKTFGILRHSLLLDYAAGKGNGNGKSPAAIEMSRWIAGRIHYDSSGQLEEIRDLFASKTSEIIIYVHVDGKRPHLHLLMYLSQTLKTIRNWSDGYEYSFKEKQTKGESKGQPCSVNMISYLSRGELEPYYVHPDSKMLNKDLIAQFTSFGYKKKPSLTEEIGQQLKKLREAKHRLTEYDMVLQVQEILPPPKDREDCIYTYKEVRDTCLKVREKNNRPLPVKAMAEFIQKNMYYLAPNDYKNGVDFWYNNLQGQRF